jgi:hypothetical protein
MPTTATIAAKTLPFSTFSWLKLEPEPEVVPEPLPLWEKLLPPLPLLLLPLLPLEPLEPLLLEPEDGEAPPGLFPEPPPLRPGMDSGVLEAEELEPEADDEGELPAFMFRPVSMRFLRTVGLSPSTTVSLVPATLL